MTHRRFSFLVESQSEVFLDGIQDNRVGYA